MSTRRDDQYFKFIKTKFFSPMIKHFLVYKPRGELSAKQIIDHFLSAKTYIFIYKISTDYINNTKPQSP